MKTAIRFVARLGTIAIALVFALHCSRAKPQELPEPPAAPPAPSMPASWTIETDKTLSARQLLDEQDRLQGRIATMRSTIYAVHGKRIQLNTIVPVNADEGDKIYRILANRKTPESIGRKAEAVFEFVAGADSIAEVKEGRLAVGL